MATQNEILSKYRSIYQNSNGSKSIQDRQSSIKNQNLNIEDFLFELIKSTRGVNEYKDLLVKNAMNEMKRNGDINKVIKNIILSKFACNNNIIILPIHTVTSNIGIPIALSEIDLYGLFKQTPTQTPSKYFYEGLDINKHVNYILYSAKDSNDTNPLKYYYNGKLLFSVYYENDYTINFKFGDTFSNKPFADWVNEYVDSIMPLYNQVNFTATLTDIITGVLSLKSKGELQVKQNSLITRILKTIFGFCDTQNDNNEQNNSSPKDFLFKNADKPVTNTNFGNSNLGNNSNNNLRLSDDDLKSLNEETDLKTNSKLRFYTCNNLDVDINSDDLLAGLDELFNDTSNDGIIDYSTGIKLSSNSSYDNKSVDTDKLINSLNQNVKNGVKKIIDDGEIDLNLSLPNMQYELNLGMFQCIPYAAVQSIMTPRFTIINKLYSVLSGDSSSKNLTDTLSDVSNIIKTIGVFVAQAILKAAFDIIKNDITKIAEKIILDILSEQIGDYYEILLSLFSIFNRLKGLFDNGDCESILSKLLALLNLAGLAPAKTIPPFLIPLAIIRPGMSKIKIINDVKGKLNDKGIDTGYVLPDGSPNNLMIAVEETVNSVVNSIKLDSNVQVFTNGALGPTYGNAIIQ